MQIKDGTCYLCKKLNEDYRIHPVVHEHHVYCGPNRSVSEENGFKVYLCLEHHTVGKAAVHNNHENMRILQKDCQREYEKTHTRQQFMDLIGRNYLDEEWKPHEENKEKGEELGFRLLEEWEL